MRISRTSLGVVAAVGLLTTAMAVPAHADTNITTATAGAIVGSDTLDNLMEALSSRTDATANLAPDLANYLTVPVGRSIDTSPNYPGNANRATGTDCVVSAPKNSGDGRNALFASLTESAYAPASGTDTSANYSGCVVVARSSSSTFPSTTIGGVTRPANSITRIPVAIDAVAPAMLKAGTVKKYMTFDWLKAVYTRNGVAGSADCLNAAPLLPSFGSGTRTFWAQQLGITDWDFSGTGGPVGTEPTGTTVSWGSCVTGGTPHTSGYTTTGSTGVGSGQPGDKVGTQAIQEHQGTWLSTPKQLIPYSVAQWTAENGNITTDVRGSTVLGDVDFDSTDAAGSAPGSAGVVTANLKHAVALNGVGSLGVGFGSTATPARSLYRTTYLFVPTTLVTVPVNAAVTDATAQYNTDAAQKQFRRTGEGTGTGSSTAGFISFNATNPADTATDVGRFRQALIGPTAEICKASDTILLEGFAVAPNCGVPTVG